MIEKKNVAYIALGVGVAAVSTAAIFVKLSSAPSSIIAFYRLFFTVLILAVPTMIRHRKDFKILTKLEWKYSILSGIFLAFHFITWFESLKYTSVASSVVLVTLQPIFAMVGIYILFNERVSRYGLLGAGLALLGSFIIGWGDFQIGGKALFGDILALLGAMLVTGYWLVGQALRKTLSLLPYTFLVYTASSITLLLYNIVLGESFFHYAIKEWIVFLLLAIIPTIFGHTVFNWSIRYVNAVTVSVTILAEPIGASILAFIFLHEIVSLTQMIGGLIIFLGIFIYLKHTFIVKSNATSEYQ